MFTPVVIWLLLRKAASRFEWRILRVGAEVEMDTELGVREIRMELDIEVEIEVELLEMVLCMGAKCMALLGRNSVGGLVCLLYTGALARFSNR